MDAPTRSRMRSLAEAATHPVDVVYDILIGWGGDITRQEIPRWRDKDWRDILDVFPGVDQEFERALGKDWLARVKGHPPAQSAPPKVAPKPAPAPKAGRLVVTVYEIEHHGDLDHAVHDIHKAGGTPRVLSTDFEDSESARIEITAHDIDAFKARFKDTDTYGFTSLAV